MSNTINPISVVAVIPARGGSKGVPRKNMRLLAGEPLLWYIIQSALKAHVIEMVVVSTEDDEIARYAESLGVSAFRHPARLSVNDAPSFPVVKWALNEIRRRGVYPDYCVILRATAPLVEASDIERAVQLLRENDADDSVVSVVSAAGIHPMKLKRVTKDGHLIDAFEPEGRQPKRRQELELLYLRNGAIYVAKSSIIDNNGLWGSQPLAYIMPEERSININTDFQFRLAELIIIDNRTTRHEWFP